jgi:hypothetical protein
MSSMIGVGVDRRTSSSAIPKCVCGLGFEGSLLWYVSQ